ncbi:hypothetical protein C1H46_033623 [Malus baccata]|uniref:F-box domain-containing protein n=1 Tax=Malus baccata TaxID=106549 RepID=A0A540L2U1_MALBA|nr:hypothetical protein C1H46_033623 [Malus baccata]
MTTLIRKVWELVSSRTVSSSESTSSSSSSSSPSETAGFGAFDRVPTDLLMQIEKLVGPKEAVKLSVVCRAWQCVVSENELWIFFLKNQKLEEENYWESFAFSETHLRFGYPLQEERTNGVAIVQSCHVIWNCISQCINGLIESRSSIHCLLLKLQATLALYAARRTSGIVVNIGFQVTSIVPILNGKVMRKVGVEVMGLGALKLTGFLRELLQQSNINFDSLYTVRTVKGV